MKGKINILFICKWNRFRSRLAASYFKKINRNKNIKVKSCGIIKGRPVDDSENKLAEKFGVNIQGSTKGLSCKLLKWQDIIVLVAGDIPKEIFTVNNNYTKKFIYWKFPDCLKTEKQIIDKVIIPLMRRVEQLNKDLEMDKIEI